MWPLMRFHMKLGEFKTMIATEIKLAISCSLACPGRIAYGVSTVMALRFERVGPRSAALTIASSFQATRLELVPPPFGRFFVRKTLPDMNVHTSRSSLGVGVPFLSDAKGTHPPISRRVFASSLSLLPHAAGYSYDRMLGAGPQPKGETWIAPLR